MIDWLFSTEGFVPRKVCGAWTPELIWLHVGSDLLIWLAYLSITLMLVYFAGHRRLGKLRWIVWLFAAFILSCGFTHFAEALIFERPIYHLSGVLKAVTAVVSWITVLALITMVPQLIPSQTTLGDLSRETPSLNSMTELPLESEHVRLRQYVVAVLAAAFAIFVRWLFEPIMAGDHPFVIPLLAVVFVSWHSGFWPGILALLCSVIAAIYFFIEPKHSLIVAKFSDQLAVGFFLFAGVGCALLGQAQMNSRRKAARNLATSEAKQRALELLAEQLAKAERRTAETLAQLDMFVMNAPLGMAFFDRDLRFVRINKHLAEAYGLSIEEHLGRPITEAIKHMPPEGLDDYRRVLETGESLTDRLVVGLSDIPAAAGRVWESSYYPVRQADGHMLGVGVVTREISQKLRDEKAIQEREERFRSLAEAMPQIVWVGKPDGYLEYINPNWYAYSGRTAEESLGWEWLAAVHPEDQGYSERRWQLSTKTGTPFEITYRLRSADGTYRWFLGRALPQRDESGTILRWFGTCTDIDDAKRIEDALKVSQHELRGAQVELENRVEIRTRELLEAVAALQDEVDFRRRAEERVEASAIELRRSNGELEQFAYVASHDLQEPLRKIQAFGDRLKVKCASQLGDDGVDYLERMLSSSSRMRQLINDLLAYSRVTTKIRTFLPVNLAAVMQGVLSDLEVRIQQTGAEIDVGELPAIDADPLQMRQLFQNLIGNALKFSKPDHAPHIAVQATMLAGMPARCELQFRDDGIGFDEKYLDRIFQVFQRLHGRGEYEGTGVGLAICHKIVLLHGGEITARSRPGEGATFIVTLPLHQCPVRTDADE